MNEAISTISLDPERLDHNDKDLGESNSRAFISPATMLGQIDEREVDAYYAKETPRCWNVRSSYARWKLRRQNGFAKTMHEQQNSFSKLLGVLHITQVWSTTNRSFQLINNGQTYHAITVIHSFFDPLQGFLNSIVYQRPQY